MPDPDLRKGRDQGSLAGERENDEASPPATDKSVEAERRDIEREVYRRRSDPADIPAPKQP